MGVERESRTRESGGNRGIASPSWGRESGGSYRRGPRSVRRIDHSTTSSRGCTLRQLPSECGRVFRSVPKKPPTRGAGPIAVIPPRSCRRGRRDARGRLPFDTPRGLRGPDGQNTGFIGENWPSHQPHLRDRPLGGRGPAPIATVAPPFPWGSGGNITPAWGRIKVDFHERMPPIKFINENNPSLRFPAEGLAPTWPGCRRERQRRGPRPSRRHLVPFAARLTSDPPRPGPPSALRLR